MENPNFYLEGIVRDKNEMQDFEGPLSLILQLLSKNKIEIRDIRISEILDQYLAYLDEMQSMDLEIASEFVQMAAHLLYIKTRTLLAGEEEVSELELLMTSLEQLKARGTFEALQQVLPELRAASERGMLYCAKAPEPLRSEQKEYSYRHEPIDLLRAMARIYARGVKPAELSHPRFTEAGERDAPFALSGVPLPLRGRGDLPLGARAVQHRQRRDRARRGRIPSPLCRRGCGRDPEQDN